MILPDTIKMGFEEFRIQYEHNLLMAQRKLACLFPTQDYVKIHRFLEPDVKARNIFYALHLWICNQVSPDLENSEQHSLSECMYAILRDNPELVRLKLVNSIHVSGDDYEVLYKEPPDHTTFASWSNVSMKIWVNQTGNHSCQVHSLFHEIYHLAYSSLHFEFTERDVDLFSWFLCQALHQNDMWWLIEAEEVTEEGVPG